MYEDSAVFGFSDWSSLPSEIWSLVFEKLPLEEFICCQSVCSSWLSIIHDLRSCSPEPRSPWLMIAPEDRKDTSQTYRFFDIANGKMHNINLPELDCKHNSILGSFNGWLVVQDDWRFEEDLRLFNPFTRAQIHLPAPGNRDIFQAYLWTSYDGDYTVVIEHGKKRIAEFSFVRAGDKTWTRIEILEPRRGNWSGTLCKDVFYALDKHGQVVIFDLSHYRGGNNLSHDSVRVASLPPLLRPVDTLKEFLVMLPTNDKILLLRLFSPPNEGKIIDAYNLDQKEAIATKNLEGFSVFLINGCNSSSYNVMNLPHPRGHIQLNCVYMVDEMVQSVNVFNLESPLVTKVVDGFRCHGNWGPPIWITPILVKL